MAYYGISPRQIGETVRSLQRTSPSKIKSLRVPYQLSPLSVYTCLLKNYPTRLLHRQPAIHIQRDPRNPLRIVTGKVHSGASVIERITKDAARNHSPDAVGSGREGAAEGVVEHYDFGD